jgi:hypothetical protein
MPWEALVANIGIDAVRQALAALRRRTSKKQFAAYLSAAVTELLELHPDIDLAEAKLLAAEATGEPPSPELLRARQMLAQVKTQARPRRRPKKAVKRLGPATKGRGRGVKLGVKRQRSHKAKPRSSG